MPASSCVCPEAASIRPVVVTREGKTSAPSLGCLHLPAGKPRGINAARKLRTVRRQQRWAQKRYKKAHLGTQFKCNPFGGSSHCKGIVLEKMWAAALEHSSSSSRQGRAGLARRRAGRAPCTVLVHSAHASPSCAAQRHRGQAAQLCYP